MNFGSTTGNVAATAHNACGSSGTKTLAVTFNCRLSFASSDNESALQASPNPVHDVLQVIYTASKPGNAIVRINDVLGKEMIVKNVTAVNGNNMYELNLGKLNSGVYLLSVDQNGSKKIMRIIINLIFK